MFINTKYTNLESTPAMEEYIKEKIGFLARFIEPIDERGAAKCFVEIARTTKHHQKGDVFRAECNLELPGKLLRAEHEDWDARRAVDEVKKTLELEIKKYKEKRLEKLRGK